VRLGIRLTLRRDFAPPPTSADLRCERLSPSAKRVWRLNLLCATKLSDSTRRSAASTVAQTAGSRRGLENRRPLTGRSLQTHIPPFERLRGIIRVFGHVRPDSVEIYVWSAFVKCKNFLINCKIMYFSTAITGWRELTCASATCASAFCALSVTVACLPFAPQSFAPRKQMLCSLSFAPHPIAPRITLLQLLLLLLLLRLLVGSNISSSRSSNSSRNSRSS